MDKTQELQQRIEILERFVENLQASHKIPLAVDQAFRARFPQAEITETFVDGGDGGSVDVSVYNSFNVNVPIVSGKRTIVIDGVSYNFLYQ